ncbi:hypothetical protein ACH4HG_22460 [Streptomyces coeruleorubidus]|uniref:hypothetical protein n=1 Tax=Streptomyces coeruleorubidus TaxID=116188 RepID=UPI0037904904
MGQVPEGYHRVRGHIRRNPARKGAKRLSAWTIAGLIAGVWLWGQVFEFDEAASAPPTTPQPSLSASAGR